MMAFYFEGRGCFRSLLPVFRAAEFPERDGSRVLALVFAFQRETVEPL
jgi:hypothetical protein